jgi:hypothetical protein
VPTERARARPPAPACPSLNARTHTPPFTRNAEFKSPADVADFDVLAEAFVRRDEGADTVNVEVSNPYFDYVPPHLVSLFVTDTGGYTPSYVYRLLAEYYSRWAAEGGIVGRRGGCAGARGGRSGGAGPFAPPPGHSLRASPPHPPTHPPAPPGRTTC